MFCASCEAVMLVWCNILLRRKTGKQNVIFCFWGKFQFARVPRCFDKYNINEWKGYGVWRFSCTYCTRCGRWYRPLPYIQSLIFWWWGKLSSNGRCLPLATNTAPGQRSEPSRPRCIQTYRMKCRGTNNTYVVMYLLLTFQGFNLTVFTW